jgi:Holliday junction resolvase-like predicted endonuclease
MKKVGLWQVDNNSLRRLDDSSVGLEAHLENWIENDPSLVQAGLEIVGRQINIEGGKLDLLALDPQGRWIIIEIKKDILRREVISQVLDYASSIHGLSEMDFKNKIDPYLKSKNKTIDALLEQRDALDSLNPENREMLFFVVGTGKHQGLERISNYLADQFKFPISIITFQVFETSNGEKILAREITESDVIPDNPKKMPVTVENVFSLAQKNGLGDVFNTFKNVSDELGFYQRPYKRSIMFTSPKNKTRMLFTIWGEAKDGKVKVYVGPSAFSEFYPIAVTDVITYLGVDGWRYMTEKDVDEFVTQLKNMFSLFSKEENE